MHCMSHVNKIFPKLLNITDRPLPELGIRPILAFIIGGTAPALESLESMKGVNDCACV